MISDFQLIIGFFILFTPNRANLFKKRVIYIMVLDWHDDCCKEYVKRMYAVQIRCITADKVQNH